MDDLKWQAIALAILIEMTATRLHVALQRCRAAVVARLSEHGDAFPLPPGQSPGSEARDLGLLPALRHCVRGYLTRAHDLRSSGRPLLLDRVTRRLFMMACGVLITAGNALMLTPLTPGPTGRNFYIGKTMVLVFSWPVVMRLADWLDEMAGSGRIHRSRFGWCCTLLAVGLVLEGSSMGVISPVADGLLLVAMGAVTMTLIRLPQADSLFGKSATRSALLAGSSCALLAVGELAWVAQYSADGAVGGGLSAALVGLGSAGMALVLIRNRPPSTAPRLVLIDGPRPSVADPSTGPTEDCVDSHVAIQVAA